MPEAISDTSPLLYLHRAGHLEWLPRLFDEIWVPNSVIGELEEGRSLGYDAPDPSRISWIRVAEPRSIPSTWLALDLGRGELNAMALAMENRKRIVLLDDALARRTAQAAALQGWGTLQIMLEAKNHGLIASVEPCLDRFIAAGMWCSGALRARILVLASEVKH